ncbi:unnamed protein product [Clonostachys rosea]|uniref:Zn(2)-C6 fungal-type domain-containing protein n=1 Tax=Bionectria ochroleuca TaxID=29856 RepID=A0ABY6TW18_BIOOC|nr:unnamed protein product [Clonostachys rosea]
MDPAKPKKACYHCMKRRIKCDLTLPKCQKCAKKGLECPGYGIRYRFSDDNTTVLSEEAHQTTSFPAAARDWKWVDDRRRKKARVQRQSVSNSTCSTPKSSENKDMVASRMHPAAETTLVPMHSHDSWAPGDVDCSDPISPTVELVLPGPARPLCNLHPKMRFFFHHFSTHVSPVMLMYDDEGNGYRHQILPLATSDPLVARAVCVAAAFHLSWWMPQLRLPAESCRAAIISKLMKSSFNLNDQTWATIILLIVADLVTGHEHAIVLYQMLAAFLDARAQHKAQGESVRASQLEGFLHYQSRMLSFFANPVLGESKALTDYGQVLGNPLESFEKYAPKRRHAPEQRPPVYNEARNPGLSFCDSTTPLYGEIVREATQIYIYRARMEEEANNSRPHDTTNTMPLQSGHNQVLTARIPTTSCRVARMRRLFEKVDPSSPGSHTIAWPAFIAAAEASKEEDRQFFSATLERIWASTRYANVLRGLNALPMIWERQRHGERWTTVLPQLKTFVM